MDFRSCLQSLTTNEASGMFGCTAIEATHVGKPYDIVIFLDDHFGRPMPLASKITLTALPSLQNMIWSLGCKTPREGLDRRRYALFNRWS